MTRIRLQGHAAAEVLDDLAADRQAQPGALRPVRGVAALAEFLEDQRTLRADPDRLTQVLLNLLSNAAKFVPQGRGRIEVRLRADDAGVSVQVQDNGPGVPPAQQSLIFEKFRQGGDAANRPRGTGLGLPISRRIVEHFGGRMWLRSEPGRGACFGFDLPWSGEQTREAGESEET